jgi:hypothetical protein
MHTHTLTHTLTHTHTQIHTPCRAMLEGDFQNLKGAGKPISYDLNVPIDQKVCFFVC